MATTIHHGGSCCGVRHIYGMDNTTIAQLDEHIAAVDAIPNNGGGPQSGRLIEIILSSRQVGERNPRGGTGNRWAPCVVAAGGWPAVLQERGFRLVSRFENKNSGADCYIFHRVPHFKSLRAADLPFTWDHGSYQREVGVDAGGQGNARRGGGRAWAVGDRVRYSNNGGALSRQGRTGTIRARSEGDNRWYLDWDDGECRDQRYSETYFFPIETPAAPAPVVVRDILTRYQNVFADGREGGEYPTLEAARAAAPRCRRQDRIVYRSDGTNARTQNV